MKPVGDILPEIHRRFEEVRASHGEKAVAGLGSATSTNEALFLMKRYFNGHVDFRLGEEDTTYDQRQDDMLRRLDKQPNTRGALDLGADPELRRLEGLYELAEEGRLKAVWIVFHPQLVGEDSERIVSNLGRLISAVEFSVVCTTHEFRWAADASALLLMAAWSEEQGTYTNYAGRVQITNRAVMPRGEIRPLHRIMADMLKLRGDGASTRPSEIFEEIAKTFPAYRGLDYETIGPLGAMSAVAEPEVVVGCVALTRSKFLSSTSASRPGRNPHTSC